MRRSPAAAIRSVPRGLERSRTESGASRSCFGRGGTLDGAARLGADARPVVGGGQQGHRQARGACACRPSARPARPRTIATPCSSASPAIWWSACGSAATTTSRLGKITGGTAPAQIWRNFMVPALAIDGHAGPALPKSYRVPASRAQAATGRSRARFPRTGARARVHLRELGEKIDGDDRRSSASDRPQAWLTAGNWSV